MKPAQSYTIKFHRPDGSVVQLPNPANPAEMIDGVETNSVQFVRLIKKERPADYPATVSESAVIMRMAQPMVSTGEDYKRQVAVDDKNILLASLDENPGDVLAGVTAAQAKIAALNDPNQ